MNRWRVVFGVMMIALGSSVLFSSHTLWGLRGIAEEALGVFILYRALGSNN